MLAMRRAIISLALLPFALGLASASRACELKITWKAALESHAKGTPTMPSHTMGTAAIDFDLAHPGATVQVETKNLQDVQAVEMRVARSYTDHSGPVVLTLYAAGDGPLPAVLTKHVGETDLHKQATPKVATFADLVSAVLNGRAYVVVVTKAHPEGEFSGFIHMHKEEVYSDSAADPAHNAALHHGHPSASFTPSTP